MRRRLFGSGGADDPYSAVRVPRNRNPPGRAGAIALEEPEGDRASKRWVDDPLSRSRAIERNLGPSLSFVYASSVRPPHGLKIRVPQCPIRPSNVPRWHGTPIEVGDLFRLHKTRREARAALFTHQLGWEVRLLVGSQLEVVQTQVCRDQEEVLATGEEWKGNDEKGWA